MSESKWLYVWWIEANTMLYRSAISGFFLVVIPTTYPVVRPIIQRRSWRRNFPWVALIIWKTRQSWNILKIRKEATYIRVLTGSIWSVLPVWLKTLKSFQTHQAMWRKVHGIEKTMIRNLTPKMVRISPQFIIRLRNTNQMNALHIVGNVRDQ